MRNKICFLTRAFLIHMKVLIIFIRNLIELLVRVYPWLLNLCSIYSMNVWRLLSVNDLLSDVIVRSDHPSLGSINVRRLLRVFKRSLVVFHSAIVQGPRDCIKCPDSKPLSIIWNHVKLFHLSSGGL